MLYTVDLHYLHTIRVKCLTVTLSRRMSLCFRAQNVQMIGLCIARGKNDVRSTSLEVE